ncbi:hypothetical protein [Kitasatospora sp. NBC_01539]|uniref:hypothetical protein n=1 Tax=Kitasatospora sp. NBC_01539 TaxID=2903577 RepID=UPI0038602DDD
MTDGLTGAERTELALRARFHDAVVTLEPDPSALGRIRSAVPRRRARRRQAWAGAVAVALLSVAAVPVLHAARPLALSGGPAAGSTEARDPSAGPRPSPSGRGGPHPLPVPAVPGGGPAATPSGSALPSPGTSATSAATASVPACVRADLGRAEAHADAPDSAGNVYGYFTVRNVSARSCGITGPGTVTAVAAGGADQSRVKVADHIAGDAAAALPPPGPVSGPLLLAPGTGYRVRFGWVPEGTCPSGAAEARAATTADPAAGPTEAAAPESPTDGPSPTATPPAAGPSVTVAHTPDSGTPEAAGTVVTGSCGGTVYRTAPEPVPADPAPTAPATG